MRDGKSAKDKGYSLRDWFKGGGWVQAGGKYDGKPCAKQPGQKTKPYCRDPDDRASLDKEERNKRAAKKRKEDPNPNRKGKAKMVTQEAANAAQQAAIAISMKEKGKKPKSMKEAVSEKDDEYSMIRSQLKSIHNAASRLDKKVGKNKKGGMEAWVQSKITKAADYIDTAADYATSEEVGCKNCDCGKTKKEGCGCDCHMQKEAAGEKDACYKKVKSRYSVWPSAYASGALVKCRKVGAKNWGNKKEEVSPIVAKVLDEKCWTGYKQEGMKKKGKKMVPNCVPVNENIKRVQTNGRVYTVMVNFYGKYYTIRLFFSGAEQPSREEINTAVAKIYPTGKVLAYYPAMNTVGSDNYVIAREEAECKPEPKGGNTTYDSAEKRRRNYLLNIGVIGEGAAWTKKSGKSESGGLNEKGRKSYERENPGSDLKAPSKKVGNPRRASFCARMKGMKKKLTSKKTASDPNSRINKSLRAWNC